MLQSFCHENLLSLRALQQASQVRAQLADLCRRAMLEFKSCGSDLSVMRRCLLTGLYSNLATHMRDKIYVTVSTCWSSDCSNGS